MRGDYSIDDSEMSLMERQWFAARRAAAEARRECEALARVRDIAEDEWRSARSRLSQIEALGSALSDAL